MITHIAVLQVDRRDTFFILLVLIICFSDSLLMIWSWTHSIKWLHLISLVQSHSRIKYVLLCLQCWAETTQISNIKRWGLRKLTKGFVRCRFFFGRIFNRCWRVGRILSYVLFLARHLLITTVSYFYRCYCFLNFRFKRGSNLDKRLKTHLAWLFNDWLHIWSD